MRLFHVDRDRPAQHHDVMAHEATDHPFAVFGVDQFALLAISYQFVPLHARVIVSSAVVTKSPASFKLLPSVNVRIPWKISVTTRDSTADAALMLVMLVVPVIVKTSAAGVK
jgi:hypothetical protein